MIRSGGMGAGRGGAFERAIDSPAREPWMAHDRAKQGAALASLGEKSAPDALQGKESAAGRGQRKDSESAHQISVAGPPCACEPLSRPSRLSPPSSASRSCAPGPWLSGAWPRSCVPEPWLSGAWPRSCVPGPWLSGAWPRSCAPERWIWRSLPWPWPWDGEPPWIQRHGWAAVSRCAVQSVCRLQASGQPCRLARRLP